MKLTDALEIMHNHGTRPNEVISEVMASCRERGLSEKAADQAAYEELIETWDFEPRVADTAVDVWHIYNVYFD